MRNFGLLALPAVAAAAFITVAPVQANTLTAEGITYSLNGVALNSATTEFTLGITGINGPADTEGGRSGVNSVAFGLPSNFSSAVMVSPPSTFTFDAGGLNSSGCDSHGNFFCFKATTPPPSSPALPYDSALSFVFDVTLSSGSFTGWTPDFKIDWVGSQNNYNLVSQQIVPSLTTGGGQVGVTPIPATLPLYASGLGALALLLFRQKKKVAALAA